MKDSFILYTESKELVDELDTEQKASLLDALFMYAAGIDPSDELDKETRLVFKTMRIKIDLSNEKYEEKCRKNQENGAKGGRPKTEKTERFSDKPTETERFSEKPNETEKTLPEPEPDIEPDFGKRKGPTGPKEKARFIPPTEEEVEAYVREKGLHVDARRFVNFYASKNWMVGKNKMSNWHQAIAGWEARDKANSPPGKERRVDYDAVLTDFYVRNLREEA